MDQTLQRPDWFKRLHGATRDHFAERMADMPDTVVDAINDGLTHLLPVLLASGQSVPEMRQAVGRATWRKIHHASEATNFLRSLIRLRFGAEARWSDIVALPETHLRSCRNALDWQTAQLTARLAAPGRFSQTAMLFRDVIKMGGDAERDWSLSQLKRTHAHLSRSTAIAAADPTDWATPFTFRQDGYTFVRLVSDRDFVTEGKNLRHCVATYRDDAKAGLAVVLRCTGRERATLRFTPSGEFEVSGFANSAVTARCLRVAKAASDKFYS